MITTDRISYCSGYKYQLRKNCVFPVRIYPESPAVTELVRLGMDGTLTIR